MSATSIKVTVRIDIEDASGVPAGKAAISPTVDWNLESMRLAMSDYESALRKIPKFGRLRILFSFTPPLNNRAHMETSTLKGDRDSLSKLHDNLAKLDPRLWTRHLIEQRAVKMASAGPSEPSSADITTAISKTLRRG